MPRHPTDAALFDLLDGSGEPEARRHLDGCPSCQARLEQARGGLEAARGAEVPEPSPLYWEAFRAQVGRRIREDETRAFSFRPLLALAAAATLAALASVASLRVGAPQRTPPAIAALPAWSALPPAEEDAGLAVLAGLEPGEGELRLADGCATLSDCMTSLSDEESGDLLERLKDELGDGREL